MIETEFKCNECGVILKTPEGLRIHTRVQHEGINVLHLYCFACCALHLLVTDSRPKCWEFTGTLQIDSLSTVPSASSLECHVFGTHSTCQNEGVIGYEGICSCSCFILGRYWYQCSLSDRVYVSNNSCSRQKSVEVLHTSVLLLINFYVNSM